MQHPDDTLRLPMIDEARSLNLSNSVAIAAYESFKAMGFILLCRTRASFTTTSGATSTI